jgi:hypothetical protein
MNQNLISEDAARDLNIKSPLVRRLVYGVDDPVKHRVRRWLTEMDDERLLRLGINARDGAALRATPSRAPQVF